MAAVTFEATSNLKKQPTGGFPQPINAELRQTMPNKATSRPQFRFLQGVKHGSIQAKGLSENKASEMLGHQSPKGLPSRAPKMRHRVKFPSPTKGK